MDTLKHHGDRVDWLNEESVDKVSGDVIAWTDFIGVLVTDIDADEVGAVEISHIHELAADATIAWELGVQLYWDGTQLTTTASANVPAGMSADKKATFDSLAQVVLNKNTV